MLGENILSDEGLKELADLLQTGMLGEHLANNHCDLVRDPLWLRKNH